MEGANTRQAMADFDKALAHIDEKSINLKRKVPMTLAPYPISWEPDRTEHRTNIRLAYWTRKGTALARARGWMVLDQFNLGLSLEIEMLASDGLHLAPS